MSADRHNQNWSLEVVRGQRAGQSYPIGAGATVLGNDLGRAEGVNLADQEGNSPRRMAARHAQIERTGQKLLLKDLDSPGGTFVNRQRLLPGQARDLQPGDLIQLGGVQLRVVSGQHSPTTTAARPVTAATAKAASSSSSSSSPPQPTIRAATAPTASKPLAFTLQGGSTCRTWDDFLAISAQRWADLREELTSGRLAAYLTSIGRSELAPSPQAAGTPDERLDAWLGSLPTTKLSQPELDVHPSTLTIRSVPGGGTTRRSLHITNVGYRLLRSKVRVEPPDANWLKLRGPGPGQSFVTVDQTELSLEVAIPDALSERRTATLVIDSNGGTKRVPVVLERATTADSELTATGAIEPTTPAWTAWELRDFLARQSLPRRLIACGLGGMIGRLGLAFSGILTGQGVTASAFLPGPALVLSILGGISGAIWAARRGGIGDVPTGGFAGAFGGLLVAALAVALCQAVEPSLEPGSLVSVLLVTILWGVIGAALAGLSLAVIPPRSESGSAVVNS